MWAELGSAAAVQPDRVRRRLGYAGAVDPRGLPAPRLDRPARRRPLPADRIEPEPAGRPEPPIRRGRACRSPGLSGRHRPQGLAVGVVLANEFLDALPVHRVVLRDGKLLELYVVWRDGFAEIAAEPSTPELAARLADDGVADQLAEGQVAEICLGLAPWLDDVAAAPRPRLHPGDRLRLRRCRAVRPAPPRGTLLGYRGHRVVENPFADPGLTDLTAHVDFTAVAQLAARRGFSVQHLATTAGVSCSRRPRVGAAGAAGLAGPDPRRVHPRPLRHRPHARPPPHGPLPSSSIARRRHGHARRERDDRRRGMPARVPSAGDRDPLPCATSGLGRGDGVPAPAACARPCC